MPDDSSLREHLVELLKGGNAHADFDKAVAGLPVKLRGERVKNLPYTAWQLLEHMRIAQWDILEFSRDPKHVSPEWPAGYWPKNSAPKDDAAWKNSVKQIKDELKQFISLISNKDVDMYTSFAHGTGQNLLREALLIADHTSYHTSEIIVIRR